MPRLLTSFSIVLALAGGLYQYALRDVIFDSYGIGRVIQPIEDFLYHCRRIKHERLQACEDLWLDDEARVLYAACTGTEHRLAWNQAYVHLKYIGLTRPSLHVAWENLILAEDVPEAPR